MTFEQFKQECEQTAKFNSDNAKRSSWCDKPTYEYQDQHEYAIYFLDQNKWEFGYAGVSGEGSSLSEAMKNATDIYNACMDEHERVQREVNRFYGL